MKPKVSLKGNLFDPIILELDYQIVNLQLIKALNSLQFDLSKLF